MYRNCLTVFLLFFLLTDLVTQTYFFLTPDQQGNTRSTIYNLDFFYKFGKLTFTAHASGQHYLCFQSNSTRFSVFAREKLKLHLDVQMGEHTIGHSTEKTKDNMVLLENSLRHLFEQMMYIIRQQEYQREKEEVFRQIGEDTNSKVLWWAVVQTSILLSVGFWQMKRLKDFFIAKKLV
uniref:Si:ch211-255i20.3 n=1 Tax=Labrus bergylta TaxID=56723 RepID=A0A3Q3EN34_9LABR